jgi:serine/threonine-protein kinase
MGEGEKTRLVAGRYEVIRPLGRGGMGKVFLVRDRESGQQLAMKVLRTQYQYNERVIARFAREVAAIRQLEHPCIVKIFDARRAGDTLFYTMEYIEGRSLRDWIQKRGRLDFGSTVRVLCLVADALEHAHRVTIHRDISPDNVMVLSDGSVRLLDFGLAKLSDDNAGLTMVGVNLGKIQYNAPEQRRNASTVDHRADIYPLGVMFFEMLTGHRPKPGEKLSELRPELPPGCDGFLALAMADDPGERFPTAAEFRDALFGLYQLSQEHTDASPKTQPEVPVKRRWALLTRFVEFWRRRRSAGKS